jgi:hypothetical protein
MIYKINKVDSDDYGDKYWQYFVKAIKNNEVIWTDYFPFKPTISELKRLTKEQE